MVFYETYTSNFECLHGYLSVLILLVFVSMLKSGTVFPQNVSANLILELMLGNILF